MPSAWKHPTMAMKLRIKHAMQKPKAPWLTSPLHTLDDRDVKVLRLIWWDPVDFQEAPEERGYLCSPDFLLGKFPSARAVSEGSALIPSTTTDKRRRGKPLQETLNTPTSFLNLCCTPMITAVLTEEWKRGRPINLRGGVEVVAPPSYCALDAGLQCRADGR